MPLVIRSMHVAEIIYPGTRLDLPDRDLAFELEGMLRHLEDRVEEAAIALTMFESSASARADPRAEWERDAHIRQEVDNHLRAEVGDACFRDFDRYRLESERRVLRKRAELGVVPRTYAHKVPFIHAHSFVYAVDSFGRFLDEICDYDAIPQGVSETRYEFDSKLPMVRKIRNSAMHLEDRSRRYASSNDKRQGKRMDVQGFLGLSNLEGNFLCYTIDDGTYQKIAIGQDTLQVLVETVNKVLHAFPWKGPAHVAPS
jgi:hypothetical protein